MPAPDSELTRRLAGLLAGLQADAVPAPYRVPLLSVYVAPRGNSIAALLAGGREAAQSVPQTSPPVPLEAAVRAWTASIVPGARVFYSAAQAAFKGVDSRLVARTLKAQGWTRFRVDRASGRYRVFQAPQLP